MYNQKHLVAKRIVFGLLALAMMVVIFFFSSQNGEESGNLSNSITETVVDFVVKTFDVQFEKTEENMSIVKMIIRKLAHFSEYFVFAVFVTLFMYTFKLNKLALSGISLAIAALYATTDEFHQSFVDSRFASPIDIGIDSSGALVAILILFLIFSLAERKYKKDDIKVETYPI